jgi:7-cyano-7-deazaguanine reductase
LNQTQFQNEKTVRDLIQTDLSAIAKSPVSVCFYNEDEVVKRGFSKLSGSLLDTQDITCDTYSPTPSFLSTGQKEVTETLFSHLLKSNCPVTGQPDWASLSVSYEGKQIDKAGLLKYIVSYRHHQDFHEHCVEQIFLDIQAQCAPNALTVFARFTRRGGLDINPYRSSAPLNNIDPIQLFRQ